MQDPPGTTTPVVVELDKSVPFSGNKQKTWVSAVPHRLTECQPVRANARTCVRAGPEGRIGIAFPHKEGTGFNIQLRAFPLDGRIVLLPPDQNDTTPEERPRNR